MPCAYDKQRDESVDYQTTRRAYIAALNGTPVIEPVSSPLVADVSAEIVDVCEETADEPISIEALEAQLAALLAQCA